MLAGVRLKLKNPDLETRTSQKLTKTFSRDISWRKKLNFTSLMTITVRNYVRFEF